MALSGLPAQARVSSAAARHAASVLIADDHPPIRVLVRGLLERSGYYICAEVSDAAAAIDAAIKQAPDLCLLDIRMPGNGIAAVAAISTMVPQTKIVMVTVSSDEADLFKAIQAGAVGYMLKDQSLTQIAKRLWPVLNGEALLSGDLTARLVAEFRQSAKRGTFTRRRDDLLTRREWEVLELLAADYSTGEIARALTIEEVTVRSHISAVLRKYQVTTRQAMLRKYRGI